MTTIVIKPGTARRLGMRAPASPLLGVLIYPDRVLTPEEYGEVKDQFAREQRDRHVYIYPSEEDLSPTVRRGWFRRDSA